MQRMKPFGTSCDCRSYKSNRAMWRKDFPNAVETSVAGEAHGALFPATDPTHCQREKLGCGNPVMGWLLLLLSAVFALTSNGQTNSAYFEAFKEHLAQPVQRFEMEFEEGDVTGKPTISIEKMNSKHGQIEIIYQSVRSYSASCQSNAFVLLQKVQDIVETNKNHQKVLSSLSFGCGYYGRQAWYRNDRFNVNLETWDPANIHSNNYLWQISNWENKVWSIYYYGLPQLEPTTIHWDGTQLTAITASGETLQAYVQISKTDGTVESLTYSTEGRQGRESALVLYTYSSARVAPLLPDIIDKRILNTDHPLMSAWTAFKVRIINEKRESIAAGDVFLAPIMQSPLAVSNGVVLARRGQHFVTMNAIHTSQRRVNMIARAIITLMVLLTTVIIFLVIRNRKVK